MTPQAIASAELTSELDRLALLSAFKEGWLVGPGSHPARHADAVASMMVDHVTIHAGLARQMLEDIPYHDLASITAAELLLPDWLRSYGLQLVEAFTALEGLCVARGFLIGVQHAAVAPRRGLFSSLSKYHQVPKLSEHDAMSQATRLARLTEQLGIDPEISAVATTMVAMHSFGRTNDELNGLLRYRLSADASRDLQMCFECFGDLMRHFFHHSTMKAVMVLVEHSTYHAVLAGSRLRSGAHSPGNTRT